MRKRYRILLVLLLMIVVGYLWPHRGIIPVEGATKADWNPESFWYYPWGPSVTHKGIDIFAKEGQPVLASTGGLVVYKGELSRGGKVLLVLGPKWRLHYYAHLKDYDAGMFGWVHKGEQIAHVGTTGNAAGKAPHLHYSIMTPFPYFWHADSAKQGWLKMFYLNPEDYFSPD